MNKSTLKLHRVYARFLSTASEGDFFGIYHITSKDIAGAFRSTEKLPNDKLLEKYRPLTVKRKELANTEIKKDFNYGTLRLDQDNIPKSHGHYEPTNEKLLYETTEVKQMFVPLDYKEPEEDVIVAEEETIDIQNIPNYNPPYRIVDTQPVLSLNEVIKIFRKTDSATDVTKYANKPPLTFYFENEVSASRDSYSDIKVDQERQIDTEIQVLKGEKTNQGSKETFEGPHSTSYEEPPSENFEEEQLRSRGSVMQPEEHLEFIDEFNKELEQSYEVTKRDKPQNALDYLKQVRARRIEPTSKGLKHRLQDDCRFPTKEIKLDSMGFRNYSNQVPDWNEFRRVDALKYLKESIIYNNYDIIAINKPYGIASHSGDSKASPFNVDDLMQEIASGMRLNKVHLAHRLDKTTTGVLLFAASETMAATLNKLFKSSQITKTYWCITRGIPDPSEGIIDIPIGEFTVAGKTRSCLVPENLSPKQQLARRYREARRAVTEYRTLEVHKSAALVEVLPKSGVKHQIRCHLGFGISTPILGDHKYSELGRMIPQKLPSSMLKSLHLRQTKVRTLPLHLHAKQIVIPGVKANGQTLFIHAPPPDYFMENLKSLNLDTRWIKTKATN